MNMSKLLELGFSADEITQITGLINLIKTAKPNKLDQVNKGYTANQKMTQLISRRINTGNMATIGDFTKTHFELPFEICSYNRALFPSIMLTTLPDGKKVLIKALLQGDLPWMLDGNGKIIPSEFLYGNRDILDYNTNPLSMLSFKFLPHEKISNAKDNTYVESYDAQYDGNAPVFLGIELEVERKNSTPAKIERLVIADLGKDYAILKSDSSLDNGFEIVTAPATIGYHLKSWDKFFDKENGSARFLSSYANGRCGMHVHIDRKCMTPMHLAKLTAFLNNIENREFLTTIAGRASDRFAKFTEEKTFSIKAKFISSISALNKELINAKPERKKEIQDQMAKLRSSAARGANDIHDMLNNITYNSRDYKNSCVNLAKLDTVEIRIFKGNVSKIGMLKNLEFVHASVEFCREATFRTKSLDAAEIEERILKRKENTDYTLHHTYFMDWLSKDTTGNYNNLKLWLQDRKITNKFLKKKQSSKTPPDKMVTNDDIRACA